MYGRALPGYARHVHGYSIWPRTRCRSLVVIVDFEGTVGNGNGRSLSHWEPEVLSYVLPIEPQYTIIVQQTKERG
jgi:hypothetical protein